MSTKPRPQNIQQFEDHRDNRNFSWGGRVYKNDWQDADLNTNTYSGPEVIFPNIFLNTIMIYDSGLNFYFL